MMKSSVYFCSHRLIAGREQPLVDENTTKVECWMLDCAIAGAESTLKAADNYIDYHVPLQEELT